jgi:hypothetical protein
MKKYFIKFLIITALFRLDNSFGQSVGFLEFSPDAKSLSLGGTSAAFDANGLAFFNNGASISFSDSKFEVSTLYASWLPNSLNNNIFGLAGFMKLGSKSALSFGYRKIGYSSFSIIDDNGNYTGTFTPKESSIGLGFSYEVQTNFSAFANIQFISSDMGGSEVGKAVAFNFDFQYKMNNNLNFGAKLSNLGSKIDYGYSSYSLPTNIAFGAGYKLLINDKNHINGFADFGYFISSASIGGGIGVEYIYSNFVFIRVGSHYGNKEKGIPSYVSSGLGVEYKGLSIDFAYLIGGKESPIANSYSVSFAYAF